MMMGGGGALQAATFSTLQHTITSALVIAEIHISIRTYSYIHSNIRDQMTDGYMYVGHTAYTYTFIHFGKILCDYIATCTV